MDAEFWEYKLVKLKAVSKSGHNKEGKERVEAIIKEQDDMLNDLGNQGWELVSVIPSLTTNLEYNAYFKKRKKEQELYTISFRDTTITANTKEELNRKLRNMESTYKTLKI